MEAFMSQSFISPEDEAWPEQDVPVFTPLDAVFAEYDCLAICSSTSPLSHESDEVFSSDLACSAPVERATPAEALRSDCIPDYSETAAAVPLVAAVSTSTATTESGCDDDEAPAPAARSSARGGSKARGRSGQQSSSRREASAGSKRSRVEFQTMSGVLQPFDVIKNYGAGGTLSLQQLNAKIKGSCKTL